MSGPILDAGQPPRGLAEPADPARGTSQTRIEEEPSGTGGSPLPP